MSVYLCVQQELFIANCQRKGRTVLLCADIIVAEYRTPVSGCYIPNPNFCFRYVFIYFSIFLVLT